MNLKEAWGSYMDKFGLSSSTKEAPDPYPVSPKHRRYPGPDDAQPTPGGRIDRTEKGGPKEIDSDMHLEPQALEVRVHRHNIALSSCDSLHETCQFGPSNNYERLFSPRVQTTDTGAQGSAASDRRPLEYCSTTTPAAN